MSSILYHFRHPLSLFIKSRSSILYPFIFSKNILQPTRHAETSRKTPRRKSRQYKTSQNPYKMQRRKKDKNIYIQRQSRK